jgi:hypothetical protein
MSRLYITIGQIGHCDERGKARGYVGYKGKIIARPDEPLFSIVGAVVAELLPFLDHPSVEAANADRDKLIQYLQTLKAETAQPQPETTAVAKPKKRSRR